MQIYTQIIVELDSVVHPLTKLMHVIALTNLNLKTVVGNISTHLFVHVAKQAEMFIEKLKMRNCGQVWAVTTQVSASLLLFSRSKLLYSFVISYIVCLVAF